MSYRKYLITSDEPPSELYKSVEVGTNLAEVGTDCISRQSAIDELGKGLWGVAWDKALAEKMLRDLPSAQPDRDIPVKPVEATDKAWGIPSRQAVCPKCDYYLGHVAFLGDYKGKRITYCETCGQAIDWEGWEFDE